MLTPFVIQLLFSWENAKYIFSATTGEFYRIWFAPLCVLLPYSIIYFLFYKFNDRLYKVKYIWVLFFLILSHFPLRASKSVAQRNLGSFERPSIYNGWKILNTYLFNVAKKPPSNKKFEDYIVEKTKPLLDDVNIILVMGESLNWQNQSLYGYELKTTPALENFAKEHKNDFEYKKGLSCALFTATSIPSFFNMQREPENLKAQISQTSNIFKLAKESGFTTYWLSVQSTSLLNNLGVKYIDYIENYNNSSDIKNGDDKKSDDVLLDVIKKYDINKGKNFIVLHKGNLHSPCDQYKKAHPEFGKFEMPYNNAMLYEDYLLTSIMNYIKENSKKKFYVFVTSDHGTITSGEKWGYVNLDVEGAQVPMFIYTNDDNKALLKEFKEIFYPNCYQFAELIVKVMGYKIINPNARDNIYYINGTDLLGRHGYFEIKKDIENKKIEVNKIFY
jgi:glucan phosphoethanolaminetransferase (alkaline phosphatase superfamily)